MALSKRPRSSAAEGSSCPDGKEWIPSFREVVDALLWLKSAKDAISDKRHGTLSARPIYIITSSPQHGFLAIDAPRLQLIRSNGILSIQSQPRSWKRNQKISHKTIGANISTSTV